MVGKHFNMMIKMILVRGRNRVTYHLKFIPILFGFCYICLLLQIFILQKDVVRKNMFLVAKKIKRVCTLNKLKDEGI